jgi:hypothetical protein
MEAGHGAGGWRSAAEEGVPVPRGPATFGPAPRGHDGGPISWNAATVPQRRTDFGMPAADDDRDGPRELDLRSGSGTATSEPRLPAHRRDDGGPPAGRSSVPWFGGDS